MENGSLTFTHVCGGEVLEGFKFCPHCGEELANHIIVWECPKCQTLFEDDGKPHPHGILCAECRRAGFEVVGVLRPIKISIKELEVTHHVEK